jgi:hypothetical protein
MAARGPSARRLGRLKSGAMWVIAASLSAALCSWLWPKRHGQADSNGRHFVASGLAQFPGPVGGWGAGPKRLPMFLRGRLGRPLFFDDRAPAMSKGLHRSEIAAPPAEWRHLRIWGLLVVIVLALAALAAVYN